MLLQELCVGRRQERNLRFFSLYISSHKIKAIYVGEPLSFSICLVHSPPQWLEMVPRHMYVIKIHYPKRQL